MSDYDHTCERCGLQYREDEHWYNDTCNPCARRAGLEVCVPDRPTTQKDTDRG